MDTSSDGPFQLQIALRQAEEHAQQQSYEPPSELVDLLKRTYHNEEVAFEVKRKLADAALQTARDQVAFSLRVVHSHTSAFFFR